MNYDTVTNYAENLKASGDLVQMYDFSDGVLIMPAPNPRKEGDYCYLFIKGNEEPKTPMFSEQHRDTITEVNDCGNGNYYIGVEIYPTFSSEQIHSALDAGKAKLLAGVKEHGNKQVDAAGV